MNRYLLKRTTAVLATLCCALPVLAQNSEPYFATIITERLATVNETLPETIRATLHVNNPERTAAALGEIKGVNVLEHSEETVDVIFGAQTVMPGPSERHYLGNSFVIDFEEPAVRELSEEIASAYDGPPTIEQLTEHVYGHIDDKTYSRAFDFASKVAASGTGDCTEHAVLLAALARSQGYPARVVLGTLIIDIEQESRAYGHAWAEIHNGSDWQIADATLPGMDPAVLQIRYLPNALLDNEGPGYALALMQSSVLMPSRISGIAPAE